MPDLSRNPARGEFELPFWTYHPGEPRQRFMIGGTANASLPKHGVPNIRPRALTFTMFTRLFLADVFIHGIGGALYDQITDDIIQELFQAAPSYCCVSAAWLLPLGHAFHDEDFSTLKWRRHHIFHNPQLAIDPFTSLRTDVAELIVQRKDLITQIAKSLAESRFKEREQRHGWFKQLHDINLALHQKAPRILPKLDDQITEALAAIDQNKVLLWREWFFGLHSIQSLENLKSAIQLK